MESGGYASCTATLLDLKVRKAKFKGMSDVEKVESILNHLATNSEAEVWF